MARPIKQIVNQSTSDCCDVYMYGIIGKWMDIDTNLLIPALDNCIKNGCKTFNMYVNSDGGDVIQTQALWNFLDRNDITVNWIVDGAAASCGFDVMTNPKHKIIMSKYSKLMVHCVSGCVCGDSKSVRAYADTMDTFQNDIVDMIANRCGKTKDEVTNAWFDGADHWFTPQQALDAKLCDECVDGNPNMNQAPETMTNPNDIYNFYQNQIINLKIKDSMDHKTIIPILNLGADADEAAVRTGIQNAVNKAIRLEGENGTLKTENERLNNQVTEMNKTKVKNRVDTDIADKKYGEDMREEYTSMYNENFERTEKIVKNMAGVTRINNELGGGESAGIPAVEKDWKWEDYHKAGKLENLKSSNLNHFKNLFKTRFGREYKED